LNKDILDKFKFRKHGKIELQNRCSY